MIMRYCREEFEDINGVIRIRRSKGSLCFLPECRWQRVVARQTGWRRFWRYQRCKQNPYIEEEQTTQWPEEKVRRTNNDLQRSRRESYGHHLDFVNRYGIYVSHMTMIFNMSITMCASGGEGTAYPFRDTWV